jgi:hypothetical protein
MSKLLKPYGSVEHAQNISMVGKSKTPRRLAARLASPELIAKAGGNWNFNGDMDRLVVRRKSEG